MKQRVTAPGLYRGRKRKVGPHRVPILVLGVGMGSTVRFHLLGRWVEVDATEFWRRYEPVLDPLKN